MHRTARCLQDLRLIHAAPPFPCIVARLSCQHPHHLEPETTTQAAAQQQTQASACTFAPSIRTTTHWPRQQLVHWRITRRTGDWVTVRHSKLHSFSLVSRLMPAFTTTPTCIEAPMLGGPRQCSTTSLILPSSHHHLTFSFSQIVQLSNSPVCQSYLHRPVHTVFPSFIISFTSLLVT